MYRPKSVSFWGGESAPHARLRPLLPALKYAVFILLVVALARPQWGSQRTEVLTEGINIVLALDLSESMAALDFKKKGRVVNRLAAEKYRDSQYRQALYWALSGVRAMIALAMPRPFA